MLSSLKNNFAAPSARIDAPKSMMMEKSEDSVPYINSKISENPPTNRGSPRIA